MTNTTVKKEKKLCWFGLYVLADRALLPTCVKTSQGDFDVEPIREFNYRNRHELLDAISKAVQKGNPQGDVPPIENRKKQTPMEKLAKAKSWSDLEKKSIYFSIKVFPSAFSIKAWGRAPDGTWSDENETSFDVRIPIEAGVEGLADAILDHLSKRSDLPGLPISQSA
jgi:hypothetical protein